MQLTACQAAASECLLTLSEACRCRACFQGPPGVNENPVVAGVLEDGAALKDLNADAPAPMSIADSNISALPCH